MSLENWSEDVALKYLQTVVVIDDGLLIGAEGLRHATEESLETVDPLSVDLAEVEAEGDSGSGGDRSGGANGGFAGDALEGEALLRGFAEQGLVCGLLTPSTQDELQEIKDGTTYKRLFARADVMVLDWSLAGDEGLTTRALIQNLIGQPTGQLGRLRLICVYTNHPDLERIQKELVSDLKSLGVTHGVPDTSKVGWVIQADDFRISILGKMGVSRPPHFAISEVSEGDLPVKIVKEFAQAVHGLMPGLALNSLAILRDNAPLLLQRFNGDLDPAFVSHELLTGQGKRFAVQLISREIQTILEAVDAGSVLSLGNIKSWARAKIAEGNHGSPQVKIGSVRKFDKAAIIETLSQDDFSVQKLRELPPVEGAMIGKARLASLSSLFLSEEDALQSDEHLGRLSCLSRGLHNDYAGAKSPTLQLGTILALPSADANRVAQGLSDEGHLEYWLCLQALCDSERVHEPRGFPLIPLRETQQGADFDFLVLDRRGARRTLSAVARPFQMKVVEFAPSPGEDVVRTRKQGGDFTFVDVAAREWYWVAELRAEHALRVSHQMASLISRIGLDESEWLRLSGSNKR
ncbi:response regulator receiver domain [Streptomyces sp. NPDC058108]|uniref:response regulator receiver domain n=1 Tax=Streptomyces sp. NPDC058108 TaxID=3346344 RepID=UPI0036E15B5B